MRRALLALSALSAIVMGAAVVQADEYGLGVDYGQPLDDGFGLGVDYSTLGDATFADPPGTADMTEQMMPDVNLPPQPFYVTGEFPTWDNTPHGGAGPLWQHVLDDGLGVGVDLSATTSPWPQDVQTNPYNAPLGDSGTGGVVITY